MRAAGVDCAVLAPPAWDPNGNTPSLEAAVAFPDRFAVTGDLDVHDMGVLPDGRPVFANTLFSCVATVSGSQRV